MFITPGPLPSLQEITKVFQLEPLNPDWGDVMSLEDFGDAVADGVFINYDGYGRLVIGDKIVRNSVTDINDKICRVEIDDLYCFWLRDILSVYGGQVKICWYNR